MGRLHCVFLDFDGTVTENDVGYELFKAFTRQKTEPLVQAYRRGEINSLTCLAGECDIWNVSNPNPAEVYEFLHNQPLRKGLDAFLAFLAKEDISPVILSEGFDFYIDRILSSRGLSHIRRICNTARYHDGLLKAEFPYFSLGCRNCSNCKGFHIGNERPPNASAIFVGDGHSDFHASRAADIVFARSHLAEFMKREKRTYIPYEDFYEVQAQVEIILERNIFTLTGRLDICLASKRHLAAIRSLWENGEVMRYVGYPNGLMQSDIYYNTFLERINRDDTAVYLALEDKSGNYIGEAKIASPDADGYCDHDLKLVPFYQGRGYGLEALGAILERAKTRWPDAISRVTPNIENHRAISLYLKLGFRFDGPTSVWTPPETRPAAVPVRYRTMIKS